MGFVKKRYKRKGEIVRGEVEVDGKTKTVSFRKAKSLPKGCKIAKRLCIKCFAHIPKKDVNYELKICKSCNNE